jgi:hypothetical protein
MRFIGSMFFILAGQVLKIEMSAVSEFIMFLAMCVIGDYCLDKHIANKKEQL